ncbi:AraC family transcriptional regulator [Hylemonella gracilis]|uniref:AraC family transcriptional regulator n=1 Tax=Hylemonella gracilis TaxID=80880 RepID=A0A4P6UEM6_9BURK|nr:AraC family transcriptional regulator [Hylemonella gracilis]QBK03628.1 AraC family transcriptional regulator [Hylemonella gracilis]
MNESTRIQRKVWSRQDIGLTASVLQQNDLLVHTFVTDHPSLILLRRGRKTVKAGGKTVVLSPGDAVAIAPGTTCDVQNETERGQFESTWIVCAAPIISTMARAFPHHSKLKDIAVFKELGCEFLQSFERACLAITSPDLLPQVVAEHRMQELLSWLAHSGWILNPEPPSDLQAKIRRLISAAPEQAWVSKDLAQALAMSEATFRRRLATLGQSFNSILIDVRMTTALTLLQVTDHAISDIAYQVGYESASRFSARFKKRFGFSPTVVRGAPSPRDAA